VVRDCIPSPIATHGGNERGIVSLYSLVSFEEKASRKKADTAAAKVDISSGERVTNPTEKDDIFSPQ